MTMYARGLRRRGAKLAGLGMAVVLSACWPGASRAQYATPVMTRQLHSGAAVKVQMLQSVNSGTARVGDRVRVRVSSDDRSGLPVGTEMEGRVTEVRAATNREQGLLNIAFMAAPPRNETGDSAPAGAGGDLDVDSSRAPRPDSAPLGRADTAEPVSAPPGFLTEASARLVGVKPRSDKSQDIGIGAGAGAVLGYIRKRKLGDLLGGAAAGAIGGYAVNQAQKRPAGDVNLAKGSALTIHLDTPLTVRTEIVAPY